MKQQQEKKQEQKRERYTTTIFGRVGFEVTGKDGRVYRHFYRDYHLLTPMWKVLPLEQLAALERLRRSLATPTLKAA